MIESAPYSYKSEVKWPQLGKVKINSDVDFVYIMRKDGAPTMEPPSQNLASDYRLNYRETQQVLTEEYDIFFAKLVDTLRWGFTSKGRVEIHLFDLHELDEAIRTASQGSQLISLDPMMNHGVEEFKISRGFYLGGKKDIGHIPRPKSNFLNQQAKDIKDYLRDTSASVVDDDIFSGSNLITSLSILLDSGIAINQVIPGIQVGKSEKLASMGIAINPIITYEVGEDENIFDKVNLGDPRNYLVGASGLVVKLPNGEYGRAPYLLPFVSTSTMARIPQNLEKEFSLKMLQANFEFFHRVEQRIRKPILLSHMNPDFIIYVYTMHGINKNTSMQHLVSWAIDNLDTVWDITQRQGKQQENLDIRK